MKGWLGAIQVLSNADGGGEGVTFIGGGGKRYKGVRFNVISVTRRWVSNFQEKRVT